MVNNRKGSCQLFVNSPMDLLIPENYQYVWSKASLEEQEDLKIFYFIFGQFDSGPHNLVTYRDTKTDKVYLIAIDNSGICNHQHVIYGDLPYVRVVYSEMLHAEDEEWGQEFPFHKAQVIEKPTPEKLREKFGSKLPDRFYKTFKSYNQPLKYIIYKNSLWKQYHAFDQDFMKSYSKFCSKKTQDTIKKLDLTVLKKIFQSADDLLKEEYLQAILARRDQVLKKIIVREEKNN